MNNQKAELEISEECRQVLLGSLLGDGYLSRDSKNSGYREGHSPKQKDYFDWKVSILNKYFRLRTSFSNNGPNHFVYKLTTNYSPILTQLHDIYYIKSDLPNRRWIKIVNPVVLEKLSPLAIAVWYCDDGTYYVREGSCALSTQGFTHEENLILKPNFDR